MWPAGHRLDIPVLDKKYFNCKYQGTLLQKSSKQQKTIMKKIITNVNTVSRDNTSYEIHKFFWYKSKVSSTSINTLTGVIYFLKQDLYTMFCPLHALS